MSTKAQATEKLATAAHKVVDDLAERAVPLEIRAKEQVSRASKTVSESAEEARAKASDAATRAQETMREHPFATAGVAFAAGLLTSMFLRRR